jgi:hypothetical protein
MGWNFRLALLAALLGRWWGGDKPGGSAGQPSPRRPPGGRSPGAAATAPGQPRLGRGK